MNWRRVLRFLLIVITGGILVAIWNSPPQILRWYSTAFAVAGLMLCLWGWGKPEGR